ncbi:MAG: alanine--tRNA ligase [Anaerolineae bacterium]|nr:alanine--tRNA ligase [Anaerolineae bacterium]
MSKWTSAEIRSRYLSFFEERGHTVVPSAPLIPIDDPTLLFTNAGMNQFKDVFLGLSRRPYKRAVDTQKIMRVSGKHNDLEEVGHDGIHHTFFEMLGNWSFGDYYKREAVRWAWELLTEVWGLPKERLYATVLEDDVGDLGLDQEAVECWQSETDIDPAHIVPFGRSENFWEMGDTGPCGPCSEISIDRGPAFCDKQDVPGHVCQVNGDCDRIVEFWNLVFIQYNHLPDGTFAPLPEKHVDTGMGFERMVAILQGVASNYETDLFTPIMDRIQALRGHNDAQRQEHEVAYRVIADHGRAITFLIGDGVMPGNEGREYVLRMILRRAARFGRALGFTEPFLGEVAKAVLEIMCGHFRELWAREGFILNTIAEEEERFLRTLDRGLARMDEIVAAAKSRGERTIAGQEAFVLWTQDGFPYDLTRDIAEENGLSVDREGFEAAMAAHRAISGKGAIGEIDVDALSVYGKLLESLQAAGKLPPEGVAHQYAEYLALDSTAVALLKLDDEGKQPEQVKRVRAGDRVEVVLVETPFYVESGGQVSDTGVITAWVDEEGEEAPAWVIEVEEVRRPVAGLIVHAGTVESGSPHAGERVWAVVDGDRRMDIARNHTATHLLHSELRYVLGEHVQQAGSMVAPDRLRFDFSHGGMLTQDQLYEVESLVNAAILADYPVEVYSERYADAVSEGAMALFGEKYGDTVRVIKVGYQDDPFSQELCGGTHVSHTSQIGPFRILSESSVAAGVRRIEAVTGTAAQELVQDRLNAMDEAAAYLGCSPEDVARRVLSALDEQQRLRKEIESLRRELAKQQFTTLLAEAQDVGGVSVLAARVDAPNVETLREMCDWFRERVGSGVVVLGAVIEGKPSIVSAVTQDLTTRGVHAGTLVRAVAQAVGGGGGGRPTMAQAGGRDASQLPAALALVPELVRESLSH